MAAKMLAPTCLAFLVLDVLLFAGIYPAEEGGIEELRSEAFSHLRKLEAAGSQLEGAFALTQHSPSSQPRLVLEGRFLVSTPSSWLQFKIQPPQDLKNGRPREKVMGKTPSYVFALSRGSESRPFVLNYFREPNRADLESHQDDIIIYAASPWSVDSLSLSELDTNPQCHVDRMQREASGLVRLNARATEIRSQGSSEEIRKSSVMTVYLDPARWWSVQSYVNEVELSTSTSKNRIIARGTLEYRDNKHGEPPVPARLRLIVSKPDGSDEDTRITEYRKWSYREQVNPNEIGLAAFGLPEPLGTAPVSRRLPTYLWLILGAVACAAVAFGLHHFGRRRQNGSLAVVKRGS